MKIPLTGVLLCGLLAGCAAGSASRTGPAPGAHAADETYAADEASAVDVAHAALAAISAEDMVAFTDLMIDEAVMFPVSERNGQARYTVRTRESERRSELNVDIVERGFDPTVHISGPVAVVWLPYDLYIDGAWSHCGVDAFTMVRVGDDWRIASLAWTVEQPPACRRHPDGPPPR